MQAAAGSRVSRQSQSLLRTDRSTDIVSVQTGDRLWHPEYQGLLGTQRKDSPCLLGFSCRSGHIRAELGRLVLLEKERVSVGVTFLSVGFSPQIPGLDQEEPGAQSSTCLPCVWHGSKHFSHHSASPKACPSRKLDGKHHRDSMQALANGVQVS